MKTRKFELAWEGTEVFSFPKKAQFKRFQEFGQSFARTKTSVVPPYVYTGPAELDERLRSKSGGILPYMG